MSLASDGERVLVEAPEADVVTLEEMKKHLREDSNDFDDYIEGLTASVISTIDPASGGGLGRALREQTWELQLRGFPTCESEDGLLIRLPFPPLIEVVSVKYDNLNGVEQTLVEDTDFRVVGLGGRSKQSLIPLYNSYWPSARCYPASVRIRFTCGYAVSEGEPDLLPEAIKAYIKLMVGDLYANREASSITTGSLVQNPNFERLLDPHRVY